MVNSENEFVGSSGDVPEANKDANMNTKPASPKGTTKAAPAASEQNNGQIYALPKYGTLVPNRIFVGGIASFTTEDDLMAVFSLFGHVRAVKIIQDRAGVSKGYGFVTFETEEEARRLYIAINSREIEPIIVGERRLNIAPAVKKQAVSPLDAQPINGTLWPDFSFIQTAGGGFEPGPPGPGPYFYTNGNGQFQQLNQAPMTSLPQFYSFQNNGSSYAPGTTVQPQAHQPLHPTYYTHAQQPQQHQQQGGNGQQVCIIPQPAPLSAPLYYPPTPPPPHLTTINGNTLIVTWIWNDKFRGWDTMLKSVGPDMGMNNNGPHNVNGIGNTITNSGETTTSVPLGSSNMIQRPEVGGGDADRNWPTRKNNEDSDCQSFSDIYLM